MGRYKKSIVYVGLSLFFLTGCIARTRTYVNIISEPPGASVSWEGKEVGQTPVLMGEIASGNVYDVRLSKKNYKSYSKLLRVEPAERSGKRTLELFVQLEPALVDPSLYDTNMNLMDRAFHNIMGDEKLASITARSGSIVVANMDMDVTEIKKMTSFVEDALVNFLTKHNYQVIEKHDQLLVQIVHEASGSLPYALLTEHKSDKEPFVYDAKIDRSEALKVKMPSAEYILAYRILDSGISYTTPEPQSYRYPSKASEIGDVINEPLTKRNAKVKLHLRLINVKAGAVIWADTVEGITSDVIPARFKEILSDR